MNLDALAPDSLSSSVRSHGIDVMNFLFPVQVEPEYESFRVSFCDRLLGELYTAQRQRRIEEIRRNIARSFDLAAGCETRLPSNGVTDDDSKTGKLHEYVDSLTHTMTGAHLLVAAIQGRLSKRRRRRYFRR